MRCLQCRPHLHRRVRDDFLTLWNEITANGVDPSQFVWSDVPPLEEDTQL
jgi:hypothetical protein